MSLEQYRTTVKRLTKKKADIETELAKERGKAEKLRGEIASIRGSLTPRTSASMRRTKEQQVKIKGAALARHDKNAARLEKERSGVLAELTRALKSFENAESKDHDKRDAADKRRQGDELKHARSVTKELKTQAEYHAALRQSRYVIELKNLPDEITVLFVAANPDATERLDLDEEMRAIKQRIRAAEHRDAIRIETCWAARANDLIQALNEHKPHIVHFSGHGSRNGELVFKRDDGNPHFVAPEAIAQAFATAGNADLCLCIFNACFSEVQARVVTQHIDFAIGMSYSVGDAAAQQFAATFYGALGFGASIERAFGQAKAAAMMEDITEAQNPQLLARPGLDPDTVFLVRPPGI